MKNPDKVSEKVTLGDVGRYCGFHRTTVGLALRKHPSIPKSTRERIEKAANELGYQPDPALASLVAYRHRKVGARFLSTIAVISDSDHGIKEWRTNNHVGTELYRGLSEQAKSMGFKLEEYSVGMNRSQCPRVSSILQARGINAAIITGLSNLTDPIPLDWENLSCVSMSYSLPQPGIPKVTTQHRSNAFMAVQKLIELGYRRIGFATTRENDARVDHAWTAGFLSACYHGGKSLTFSSIFMPESSPPMGVLHAQPLLDWIRDNGIQAIISTQQHVLDFLESSGFRVPDSLGYAGLDLPQVRGRMSGINQNAEEIGRQAIKVIASLQGSNQKGIPSFQQVHLVRGVWHEGETLMPQPGHHLPSTPQ